MRGKVYLLFAVLCAAASAYSFTRGDYLIALANLVVALINANLVVALINANLAQDEWIESRRTDQ